MDNNGYKYENGAVRYDFLSKQSSRIHITMKKQSSLRLAIAGLLDLVNNDDQRSQVYKCRRSQKCKGDTNL